jgi:hypothetical protein
LLKGNRLVAADGELVRSRTKAIYNGAAVVTVVVERARRNVRDVPLSTIGRSRTFIWSGYNQQRREET